MTLSATEYEESLVPSQSPMLVVRRSALITAAVAALYTCIVQLVYVAYLFPVFEGIGYELHPKSRSYALFAILLSASPAALGRDKLSAGGFLTSMTYVFAYIPIQVVIFNSMDNAREPLISLQVAFFVSMCTLFIASWQTREQSSAKGAALPGGRWLIFVSFGMVLAVVGAYRGHLQLVSFSDVYSLRFANETLGVGWAGYVVMWLTYVFLPLCIARGLLCRDWLNMFVSLGGALVIYMATGAKSAALAPVIAVGTYAILLVPGIFLRNVMLAVSVGLVAVAILIPDDGLGGLIKPLLFARILGTPGWTASVYYKYFAAHGFTLYSHIGLVNAFFHSYSYGPYTLGQLIGIDVSGSELTNFNANFWASDGIAALGVAGIYVITIPMAAYTYLLNVAAKGARTDVMAVWLPGFALALLNLPLETAMLSGGGALILLITALHRIRVAGRKAAFADTSAMTPNETLR